MCKWLEILKSAYKIEDALKFDRLEGFKDNYCTRATL